VPELEETCDKFDVAKQRRLEREARKAEKLAAKNVLASSAS
jgi:acyl-[acyl-carrier-protein] desaturase